MMMPLDSVTMNNTVNRRKAMNASLQALKNAGVEGIMMGRVVGIGGQRGDWIVQLEWVWIGGDWWVSRWRLVGCQCRR